MAPPNPPVFRLPSDPNPSASLFSPPAGNVPSNGLFSASSTPQQQRSSTTPATLFAGSTPGFKMSQKSNGMGLFDSPDATPKFPLGGTGKHVTGDSSKFGARAGRESRIGGKYMSPTDGDDEEEDGTQIFEDSQDEGSYQEYETHQEFDDEDDMDETGIFDDEDDEVEQETETEGEGSFDLLQSRNNGDSPRRILGVGDVIKPGIVSELGPLIINTEDVMQRLFLEMEPPGSALSQPTGYDSEEEDMDMELDRPSPPSPEEKQQLLTTYSKEWLEIFAQQLPKNDTKSRLYKAYYLVSLLLPLHHSRANVPETLRKWLYTHKQNPSRQQLHSLKSFHPNCVFSPNYWDFIHRLILRGEVQEVHDIMRTTDWDQLCVDAPVTKAPKFNTSSGQSVPAIEKRYTRGEIDTIKAATATCMKLLKACPGLARSSYAPSETGFFPKTAKHHGTSAAWRIWQGSVFSACEELRGRNTDAEDSVFDDTDDSYYNNYHPRNGLGSFGLSIASGKPKEKAPLPQDVARGFRQIYEVMRGDRDAVISSTDKWEEAVVGLMFWNPAGSANKGDYDDSVDEEDSDTEGGDLQHVDRNRRERELVRLSKTIESLMEDMPIDPTSDLDITVGGIMTGDPTAVTDFLPTFSLLAASAAVEICGWAGSILRNPINEGALEKRRGGGMMDAFNEDDDAVFGLMSRVVSEGDKADGVLKEYAAGLFGIEWLDENAKFEGWEAGVGILERVKGGKELAGKLLTQLELNSKDRVQKLLQHCNEKNLTDEASDIAASFAGRLVTSATSYGDSLYFYSLSSYHRPSIHNLLTKLLSSSLLTSSTFPPDPTLDDTFKKLLSSPKSTSSQILRFELSGYATLRNFYALRDAGKFAPAASALVATIKSAGEKLDGGVLDPEWECAVEEWTLGALLGELIPFLGSPKRCITVRECMDVMKVLTDFELVGGETMRRADEFLKRVITAKKDIASLANGGASSGRNSIIKSSSWEEVRKAIDEGVLLNGIDMDAVERSWDWRDGFVGDGKKGGLEEIIRVVRLRLSREVARAWLEGED